MATQVVERKQKSRRHAPTRYPGLTLREARAVDAFRKELRAILPNGELKSLYLYGSKPRGDANIHSDIDLFLVYDDVTTEQEKSLNEFVIEQFGKSPYIHLFAYPANVAAQDNGTSPLLYNVAHHGILLEGSPVPKKEINRRRVAEKHLSNARRNLPLAKTALDTDDYNNSISLSYYAAYYAASAALATKGLVAQSHTGTETLLTRHFIRAGLIPQSFKGLLGGGHQARVRAVYPDAYETNPVEFGHSDAEYWLGRAREFVSFVESSLETWLAEPPAETS